MDKFMDRHIGPSQAELDEMLKVIGVKNVEELISQVIPASIRLPKDLPLAAGMSEYEFAAHIKQLAAKNKPFRTFIGMGYYGTATPAAVTRNVMENPAWYTSYTPYQAEISQGRLEALLNFQTVVTSMTGMEISNCSLLDEATAAAEAMFMMYSQRSRNAVKEGRNLLFVDQNIFPQTMDLLLTRSEPIGIEIATGDFQTYEFTGREFGALVQYPNANGEVCDYAAFTKKAQEREMLVTAAVDLLSLALIKSPAEWGADIVVGSTQRFGAPMGFGGPHAGYLATKDAYKRVMPGRIIGISVDRLGNKALRMALQTREQHIKREKATSNICTAQALMASMVGFFAVYHGPKGIKDIAIHAHSCAVATSKAIKELGFNVLNTNMFDTLQIEADATRVRAIAEKHEINMYYPASNLVQLSFDEVTTLAEVNRVVAIFAEAVGKSAIEVKAIEEKNTVSKNLARGTEFLSESIFNKYHSETDLMRYIKKLERRDISLANSMISLGSCTMKLNSAASMMPISFPEFGNVHPFVPKDQAKGYMEMIHEMEKDLAIITGFADMSLQPNSGAAGEYAALMVIRAYHIDRGEGHRDIALIPASAHGTNPASAAMAGMNIVIVGCDELGNIDVADFKAKAELHKDNLSCAMITYPSTHGVFEPEIRELVDAVHSHGGQVFMDGANMNAQVGLTNPGFIGADACHLNLHKTFGMPHGGGGPGVGPIGMAAHLLPFKPSHSIVETGGSKGITAVSSAPYGSASILPITYAYIKMLGVEGLRRATEMAIVNANYMACALKGSYEVVYTGKTGRVGHEMILDLRNFRKDYGVECGDVARRLMDYGFHAPTLSFPVHDTLMVEPTESEPKTEMDRFIAAIKGIKADCEDIKSGKADAEDNVVKMAPHTAAELCADEWRHSYSREKAAYPLEWVAENKFFPYVTKIDNGYGDRNLICNCAPLESYL